ncbi:MAG: sigma-70 family RNA polymerase sigma factor [Planctomycetes bacterium]|nr:sigma-70 family RNA polymerase sigma factor [Planctomycetota bacterium]
MTTDLELVNRVRTGEIQAYARLVERYERTVLAVVLAEVRDPDAAQKLTESTLVSAYRRLEKLPDGSQFGPWLLRLARRKSIEVVRKAPVGVGAAVGSDDSDASFDGFDPDWIGHEHVLGLVARLPEDERRLVGLRYFDNHTPKEIAELEETPVEQVTRQISRAVMRLQFWWEREQDQ